MKLIHEGFSTLLYSSTFGSVCVSFSWKLMSHNESGVIHLPITKMFLINDYKKSSQIPWMTNNQDFRRSENQQKMEVDI